LKFHHSDNSIEADEQDYLYTDPSQIQSAGEGLFTAINIYKDETIAIFKGEVLLAAEATKRERQGKDRYSMNTKCFAKFANDVNGGIKVKFKNNAVITLDEYDAVCLTATRDINAKEELFCDYGKKYWKKHSI
jgi:uncharacterized protein